MSISLLQRAAFIASIEFQAQVNGIVAKEGIYRSEAWQQPPKPPLDDATRNALSGVAKFPESFNFHAVIVKDNNWDMSYDTWAADPPGADDVIMGKVQAHWLLLTGIKEPVVEEPAP